MEIRKNMVRTCVFVLSCLASVLIVGCSAYSVDSDSEYAPGVHEIAGCWVSKDNIRVSAHEVGSYEREYTTPQATCMEICIDEDSSFNMLLAVMGAHISTVNVLKNISGTIETEPVDMFGAGAYAWTFHWSSGENSEGEFESRIRLENGMLTGLLPYLKSDTESYSAYGEEKRKYSRTKDDQACVRFDFTEGGL